MCWANCLGFFLSDLVALSLQFWPWVEEDNQPRQRWCQGSSHWVVLHGNLPLQLKDICSRPLNQFRRRRMRSSFSQNTSTMRLSWVLVLKSPLIKSSIAWSSPSTVPLLSITITTPLLVTDTPSLDGPPIVLRLSKITKADVEPKTKY